MELYPEFVEVARDQSKLSEEEVVEKLKVIVDKLSPATRKTTAMIIHHLRRYSDSLNTDGDVITIDTVTCSGN